MLIPLRHENMRGRRWPYITFTLIGLNILIFLFTYGTMKTEAPRRFQVRVNLLSMAARHPDLQMSPAATAYVESVKKQLGDKWDSLLTADRTNHLSKYAAGQSELEAPDTQDIQQQLQQQMDAACHAFEAEKQSDLLDNYAFVPADPRPVSYISANFLHGGWLHLIGNMWFLWLSGFILEDNWGRLIYPIFYLIAGAAALQFYSWCAPGSYMPLVGASGAVAALMGAFLVRFPKMKIDMVLFLLYFRVRFKAPAYTLLPLWLAAEFFYGSVSGTSSPVAHWAHVGGFLFGMAGAYGLRRSGLEQQAFDAVEAKIGWTADPEIVRANEAQEKADYEGAAAILTDFVKQKPTVDALVMLQQIQWRRNDTPGYLDSTLKLLQRHLKAQDQEAAWQTFEAYCNAGGDKLPPALWLEMARSLENQQHFDRAAEEYKRLAEAHPAEKQSILALVAAGRLYLKRLNRPEDALNCYEKANASKVPHMDWQPNIDGGLADAKSAIANTGQLSHR